MADALRVTGDITALTDAGTHLIFAPPWRCTESDITPRIDGSQAEFAKVGAEPDAPLSTWGMQTNVRNAGQHHRAVPARIGP